MSLLFLHGSQVLRTFGLHFNLTLTHCLISVVCAVFHQIFVLFSSSKQKSVDYNFLAKVERGLFFLTTTKRCKKTSAIIFAVFEIEQTDRR